MKNIVFVFISAFVMNFIWEISQAFLYAPHYVGIADFIVVHLIATVGDVVMLVIIFIITSLFYKRWNWVKERKGDSYIIVALLGFIFAVAIEKYALSAGRWAYNGLMPIVPIINVGVTPVLQLTIIASLLVFLVKRYASKRQ